MFVSALASKDAKAQLVHVALLDLLHVMLVGAVRLITLAILAQVAAHLPRQEADGMTSGVG